MSKLCRILSIDGGGIRGIIPAMILAELETLSRRPVSELFDLIAGTSTGGILALGLVKPAFDGKPQYSAAQLVSLYEREGERIFREPWASKLLPPRRLTDKKYPSRGLERVLNAYFGEARLKEALTDVIIASYETERRFPFFFKSRRARTEDGYDFAMKDVARAAAAAPTYFEPFRLDTEAPEDYYSLIDGGVYANNPALCGYAEARALPPKRKDVLVVSLGTGGLTRPLWHRDVRRWGLVGWARTILDVVFEGASSTVDYQLQQLLPPAAGGAKRYWRFQARLGDHNEALDDAGLENVRSLKLLAESLIRDQAGELKTLSKLLLN